MLWTRDHISREDLHGNLIATKLLRYKNVSFVSSWPLVTHFEEKLLSATAGWPGIEDQLAITVTCHEIENLIVKVQATGEQVHVGKTVSDALYLNGIPVTRLLQLSFNITATNTGHKTGLCRPTFQKLGNLVSMPSKKTANVIFGVGFRATGRHLWYIGEELAQTSLFCF